MGPRRRRLRRCRVAQERSVPYPNTKPPSPSSLTPFPLPPTCPCLNENSRFHFVPQLCFCVTDLPSPTSPGSWNSIHVFETRPKGSRTASYSLTSTVLLWLKGGVYVDVGEATGGGSEGEVELGGSMTRQVSLLHTHTCVHSIRAMRLLLVGNG